MRGGEKAFVIKLSVTTKVECGSVLLLVTHEIKGLERLLLVLRGIAEVGDIGLGGSSDRIIGVDGDPCRERRKGFNRWEQDLGCMGLGNLGDGVKGAVEEI